VASPTEDSFVVVAAEIQYTQTDKDTFGSDAAADCLGDSDVTHASGKTVV